MASVRVLSCAILLFLVIEFVYGNVPVLLWESSNSGVSPYPATHRISSDEFQQYMSKKVRGGKAMVIVFNAITLSIEDLSAKDSQGQVYLQQLENITATAANADFMPSVHEPMDAISKLTKYKYVIKHIKTDKTANIKDGCGRIYMAELPETKPDEDRPDLLRRYDATMSLMYSQLLSKCSHVIGILTANMRSYMVNTEEVSRLRRAADDNNTALNVDGPHISYRDNQGLSLLYSSNPLKLTQSGAEVQIENKTVTVSGDKKPNSIKLVIKYGADQRLTFNFDNETIGYWTLRSVNYTENIKQSSILLKTYLNIQAPIGQSFHSGSAVIFRNRETDTVLKFENLQVQPFFMNPGSNSFGDAVDAVEFFTPAIWSGIFVTFLLALIFTWGISMIMDIRTMDQFDDPKGKTITVSATE